MGQPTSKSVSPQVYDTVKLDPTYFILGTLSDYMGRFSYVNKKFQIDRYYSIEKPLVEYLNFLITNELKINVTTVPDNLSEVSLYETFSPELSSILNSYFIGDYLSLKNLKNQPELNYSYLAGRYYRYGDRINDSIYKIQLANSSDHKICDTLLRRIGCTKIHFKYLKNIPAQFIYYFIPTSRLEEYFNSLDQEKTKLEDLYNDFVKPKHAFSDTTLKKIEAIKEKKYQEIIDLFKK